MSEERWLGMDWVRFLKAGAAAAAAPSVDTRTQRPGGSRRGARGSKLQAQVARGGKKGPFARPGVPRSELVAVGRVAGLLRRAKRCARRLAEPWAVTGSNRRAQAPRHRAHSEPFRGFRQ
jgi:hypothetical protein